MNTKSEVMKRASELRKQGFSKSKALAKAWEEAKKATTVKTTTSETSEVKSEKSSKAKKAKKATYLYDLKDIDDAREYEAKHKVTCFNLNYWSNTYNWCSSILIMAKSKEQAIRWARRNRKDFIFEDKDVDVALAHEVRPSKPCVKAF